jgi:hypothetical protein
MTTKLCDYTNVPNALCISKPITSREIMLVRMHACMHLHDFCEICDMQKFRNIYNSVTEKFPLFIKRKS